MENDLFLTLDATTWLYVGSVALFTCLIAVLAYGGRTTKEQEDHTFVHATVCAIAGTMYFAMATGVADVTLETGRNYDFGRYLDWSFTTPLLLFGLGLTAMHGSVSRKGVMVAAIGFDVLMIATCLVLGFLPAEQMGLKIVWWVLGCVFFAGVLYLVWTTLREEAELRGEVVARVYKRHATIITVLWTIYGVAILLGHNALAWWSQATTVGVIVFLDVTAKGIYGLISVKGTREIVAAEAAGRVRQPEAHERTGRPHAVAAQ